MKLLLNGTTRDFPALDSQATIAALVTQLELTHDRVAVEHNGAIALRETWATTHITENDKLEVVHFVGGG